MFYLWSVVSLSCLQTSDFIPSSQTQHCKAPVPPHKSSQVSLSLIIAWIVLPSVVFQGTLLLLGSTSLEQMLSYQTQIPNHLSNIYWQPQWGVKSTLLDSKPPSQPSPSLTDTFSRVAAWQQGSWLCWGAEKPGLNVLGSTTTDLGGVCGIPFITKKVTTSLNQYFHPFHAWFSKSSPILPHF